MFSFQVIFISSKADAQLVPQSMKRPGQATLVIAEVPALLVQISHATSFQQTPLCHLKQGKISFCIPLLITCVVSWSSMMQFSQREESTSVFQKSAGSQKAILKIFLPLPPIFCIVTEMKTLHFPGHPNAFSPSFSYINEPKKKNQTPKTPK